jgi:hypothetical protein
VSYNRSTYIAGDSEPSVHLKCGNVRVAFLIFSMIFWLFSLIILCDLAAHSGNAKLAENARAINDYFSNNSEAFMAGPVIMLLTFFYFYWSRKKLSWFNGVMINDHPIDVIHYQFKRSIVDVPLIYLQTAKRLYIVYPVTSQDGKKLPDGKIMAREMAANEIQVKLLKEKLENSSATEKTFRFFSNDVIFSFLLSVLIAVLAFSAG